MTGKFNITRVQIMFWWNNDGKYDGSSSSSYIAMDVIGNFY